MILCFKYGLIHYRNRKFPLVLMYMVIGKCVTVLILLNYLAIIYVTVQLGNISIFGYIDVI